jgi:hypothetical protein
VQRLLWKAARRLEQLLRPRAHADVAGEIAPAHGAASIDEELGGARDVFAFSDGVLVQDSVAGDRFGLRIGKQREGVARFLTKIARLLGRVDADGDRLNAGGTEIGEMLFDTP